MNSVRLRRTLPLFLLALAAICALSGPPAVHGQPPGPPTLPPVPPTLPPGELEPEPLVIDAYVACGLSRTAPRARSCPHSSRVGAFFRSSRDVEYEICVHFPTGRELCAPNQPAQAGTLSVNSVTTSTVGRHRVTWKVAGRQIVRFFWRR